MAVVNFYSSFEYKWGQTGGVIDFQDDQYKIGWAFIGSTPPSVEQFNKLQQLNDEKFSWLWGQFKAAADARKVVLGADDSLGLNKILAAATPDATTSVKGLTAYATDAEAQALTSKTKALTPYGLGLSLKDATTAVKGLTAYATDAEATALTSKTKALTPYGLGLNVQAFPNDTGAGKLLAVGRSFGIGSSSALASYDLWPSASLNDANVPSGPYYTNSTISDRPNNAGGIIWHRQAGSLVSQLYELGGAGGLLHRNGLTAAWKEVLNVGDYGVGGGTATPPNGRDGVNPMGWYYRATARPSFGGGSFFLELPYNSVVGGCRFSNDPYTNTFYLNSWNKDTGTYNPAVVLFHTGNFDPDTKADKTPASQSALGLIKIATTALAQGLTNDTDALTPKKLADVFLKRSFTQNSWYQVFPGGLIVQGGYVKDYSNYTITLPTAFPNGVLGQPIACAIGAEAAAPAAAAFPETSVVIGNQFKIFTYTPPSAAGGPWGTGPRAVAWVAFGY